MPVSVMRNVLTTDEYHKWLSYFKYKQPEINEVQLAMIGSLIVSAAGGKSEVSDFLISNTEPAKPKILDKSSVLAAFGAIPMKKMK